MILFDYDAPKTTDEVDTLLLQGRQVLKPYPDQLANFEESMRLVRADLEAEDASRLQAE